MVSEPKYLDPIRELCEVSVSASDYCEGTVGMVIRGLASILGTDPSVAAATAASIVGALRTPGNQAEAADYASQIDRIRAALEEAAQSPIREVLISTENTGGIVSANRVAILTGCLWDLPDNPEDIMPTVGSIVAEVAAAIEDLNALLVNIETLSVPEVILKGEEATRIVSEDEAKGLQRMIGNLKQIEKWGQWIWRKCQRKPKEQPRTRPEPISTDNLTFSIVDLPDDLGHATEVAARIDNIITRLTYGAADITRKAVEAQM